MTVLDDGLAVRTVETGAPGFDYDAAMLAADRGGAGASTLSVAQIGSLAASRAETLTLAV